MGTIFIQQKNRSIPVLCFVTKIHHFSIKECLKQHGQGIFWENFPKKLPYLEDFFINH
jgi:hypothetical protein